eukprot:TRINITY_DN12821_c0_g1_i1.p1 TRINITY_DN12821_c0_g1~~TRINITY_DN12821_c0_g1_i1.p1  ORF type:complete len:148 (+),score=26.23 TRINITY_DN12821_c0_g1_i1:40-483(+)
MKRKRETKDQADEVAAKREATHYIVITHAVYPVYDIITKTNQALFTDRDKAITAAKNMFFKAANDCFRGGLTSCTDQEFLLEKIETYTDEFFTDIWGECDMAACPDTTVTAIVYACSPCDDGTFTTENIYSLPAQPPKKPKKKKTKS